MASNNETRRRSSRTTHSSSSRPAPSQPPPSTTRQTQLEQSPGMNNATTFYYTPAANGHALDRWLQQSTRQDPYHNIYSVAALPLHYYATQGQAAEVSGAQSRAAATQGGSDAADEPNQS